MGTQSLHNLSNWSKFALSSLVPSFGEHLAIDDLNVRCGLNTLVDSDEVLWVEVTPSAKIVIRYLGYDIIKVSDPVVGSKSRCLGLYEVRDICCANVRLPKCVLQHISSATRPEDIAYQISNLASISQ